MGIILIGILILVCISIPVSDGDTFFHLAVGHKLCENGFITNDPFSIHTLKYSPQQWLSDVLFYRLYHVGGYTLLFIFQYFFLFLFFIVMFKINKELNRNIKQNVIFTLLSIVMITGLFLTLRPQIFTYLFFIIELFILEKYRSNPCSKYIIFLIVLGTISSNFHMGYFPMMLIILLPYIIECLLNGYGRVTSQRDIRKFYKFIVLIPLIILSACINPYGPGNLLYFKTITDQYLTGMIMEWQSPGLSYSGILIFVSIFTAAAILVLTRKNLELRWCLLLCGLCFMTLISVRYFVYFVLAFCIFCNRHFNFSFNNNSRVNRIFFSFSGPSFIYIVTIILVIIFKTINGGWTITNFNSYPVEATNYIKSHNPELRLFNEYNDGSYLLYHGIHVFIDSRADLYSEKMNKTQVLKDYFNMYSGKLTCNEVFNKYRINRILTYKGSISAIYIADDNSFSKKYEDKKYVIYERKVMLN